MKQTRNILMAFFVGALVLAGLILLVYETGMIEPGLTIDSKNPEFITLTVMEIMTLAAIYFALRLFKKGKIHQDLMARKEVALKKWGLLRMELLDVPLIANILFYEWYLNPAFGYMAIILLICQPFVFPSMSRCVAETTPKNDSV